MFSFLKSIPVDAAIKAVLIIMTVIFAASELAFKASDALAPITNALG